MPLNSLHSSKLTWKWGEAVKKTVIPYIGPSMSFHVHLEESSNANLQNRQAAV